jgi:hypothetical protein
MQDLTAAHLDGHRQNSSPVGIEYKFFPSPVGYRGGDFVALLSKAVARDTRDVHPTLLAVPFAIGINGARRVTPDFRLRVSDHRRRRDSNTFLPDTEFHHEQRFGL